MGGTEYSGETSVDSLFTTPGGHAGVTFVAGSGDSGAPALYPSYSPNVVSAGGTTLYRDVSGNWSREMGWGGSGGGISAIERQPSYQKGVVTQSTTWRTSPDISYDSDPNTGFGVYDSYNNGTTSPWGQWGGTSDAGPQLAAMIAIADQGRAMAGRGSLDGATQTLPMLYGMSTNDFHDITSGTSGGSPQYSSGPGYDLVTGRGTPIVNLVVNALVGNPDNVPPTLTTVSMLGTANQQVSFSISYVTLLAASNAQDSNNNPIQFRINSVQNGTLSITHNGMTTAVVPGTTLFGTGDALTWTGATGVSGSAVHAFTVSAFDGSLSSSPAVQVNINVQALGTTFNLGGAWAVNSSSGAAVGLGQISQTGSNLTFINSNGVSSAGQYTASNQIVAANFDNQASLAGTIDITTADYGRILWADGTVWLRVSLAGQYSVTGPGISTPTLASITQSGALLTLVNGGTTNSATITGTSQLTVSLGGGNTALATYGNGDISFSYNGQVWAKLDLPPDYTNQSGAAVHIIQNGTALTFVDKFGGTSPGYWTSPTQLFTTAWNETVTTATGKLLWQDGSIWSENLVLKGTQSTGGAITITAAPSQVTVFDYVNSIGRAVHLVQTATTNVIFIDGTGHLSIGTFTSPTQLTTPSYPGDIATISNSYLKVTWTDGTVWTGTARTAAITVTDYTNQNGVPVHLVQNGTSQLGFVDGLGRTSLGTMLSATTGQSNLYPGDIATFSGNTVTWQDGFVWTQTNVVPLRVTFTDPNGAASHVQMTTPTTLVGLDGPLRGLTATQLNGTLFWSNGTMWTNFDFNALNALFQMATGYP